MKNKCAVCNLVSSSGYPNKWREELAQFICSRCYGNLLKIKETEDYSCGACGEICEAQDGTVAIHNGLIEFTHKAELCGAQDEIVEKIFSCDDCNNEITIELSAYGNGKMATINCPQCGISYDTDLDPADVAELEKEIN